MSKFFDVDSKKNSSRSPWFQQNLKQKQYNMLNLNCFITISHFISLTWKTCEKMKLKPTGLLCADLVTRSQGQGHCMWHKMVTVSWAYRHGRHERIWLTSLCIMSNIKGFAAQDERPTGQLNTADYKDPYITHRDQQNKKSKCSNHPYSPYLQDFFTVISFTYWTIKNIWVAPWTLQQNDCTSSSFSINLWQWEIVKVIQTGIKHWNSRV